MVQTSAMATGVAIIGITNRPRSTPRSGKLRVEGERREGAEDERQDHGERRVDERMPDRVEEARIGGRGGRSCDRPAKLRAPPTFHSCRLIQIVKTHGKTITEPTTTTAGKTNGQ